MARVTKVDKAIAELQHEIHILEAAIQRLKMMQQRPIVVKPPKPRVVRESAS